MLRVLTSGCYGHVWIDFVPSCRCCFRALSVTFQNYRGASAHLVHEEIKLPVAVSLGEPYRLLLATRVIALRNLNELMYEPRYLKLSTCLVFAPAFAIVELYSVWLSLQCGPPSFAVFSRVWRRDSAFSTNLNIRERSSAKSRSVSTIIKSKAKVKPMRITTSNEDH